MMAPSERLQFYHCSAVHTLLIPNSLQPYESSSVNAYIYCNTDLCHLIIAVVSCIRLWDN